MGSRRSVGGACTAGAGSGVVGRSPATKGGVCLASSFRGVLEELLRDNDANQERGCGCGCGAGAGPYASGASEEGFVALVSDVGRLVLSAGGDDETGCGSP